MTIQTEEPGRLKVSLTGADLSELHITYAQLDYDNAKTREVLRRLMGYASDETGVELTPGRLLIEVFPAPEEGCVIYFTQLEETPARSRLRLKRQPRHTLPDVYEFNNSGDMLSAIEQLYKHNPERELKSSLYLLDGKYRLIVYTEQEDTYFSALLKEFSDASYHSSTDEAYTREHGKRLSENNAVTEVGGALAKV